MTERHKHILGLSLIFAKLLNEIFKIKIDDLNKFLVAVYNDHNNWESILTPIPSFQDQLKKLRDAKLSGEINNDERVVIDFGDENIIDIYNEFGE